MNKTRKANLKRDFVKILSESTGVISVACKKVGIHPDSFYEWQKEDEQFAKDVEKAIREGKTRRLDIARSHHVLKLQEGVERAVYFELDRRDSDYQQKITVEGGFNFDTSGIPNIHERHRGKN